LISAKFGADQINTSRVTSRKTEWPDFWVYFVHISSNRLLSTSVAIFEI